MGKKSSDFDKAVDDLAAAIARDAAKHNTSLQDRIEALRYLTPYAALRWKMLGKTPDDAGDGDSFGDFANAIKGAENGVDARGRKGRPDA